MYVYTYIRIFIYIYTHVHCYQSATRFHLSPRGGKHIISARYRSSPQVSFVTETPPLYVAFPMYIERRRLYVCHHLIANLQRQVIT